MDHPIFGWFILAVVVSVFIPRASDSLMCFSYKYTILPGRLPFHTEIWKATNIFSECCQLFGTIHCAVAPDVQ